MAAMDLLLNQDGCDLVSRDGKAVRAAVGQRQDVIEKMQRPMS